ncbi:MAG: hypothetical protein ACJ8FY_14750 [Gemmataceae bacterium]
MIRYAWVPFLAGLLIYFTDSARAEERVRLKEDFPPGYQYHASTRTELSGKMTLPPQKDQKEPQLLPLTGESALEYDERVLKTDKEGQVEKTLRVYRRLALHRKVGDQPQEASLRPEVRRLVVLRHKGVEVPFSPDGPLTPPEIDLIRTDIFMPGLSGLLPGQAVKAGERWKASPAAIQNLTDMVKIEEGELECRLDKVMTMEKGRIARVGLSGTIRGITEDGPNQQKLTGYFDFDLDSNFVSYFYLKGVHLLLDKDGKEAGKLEGRLILTRQVNTRCKELTDAAVKSVRQEPDAELMLLLYDNPEQGVRFLYPRRWHVAEDNDKQITMDGPDGSGLRLTFDLPGRIPKVEQFLKESHDWFSDQKAKVLRVEDPERVQSKPTPLDRFGLEVEIKNQKVLMAYYVTRQTEGGATLAARLTQEDVAEVRKEVQTIAKSLVLRGPAKKK